LPAPTKNANNRGLTDQGSIVGNGIYETKFVWLSIRMHRSEPDRRLIVRAVGEAPDQIDWID
jgi:hypothetical protein